MVHSYNLLNEFIDISDLTVEEIANKLTFSGFEVEGLHPLIQASHIVSGHIISCENHPDSDHLHLLKVDCGKFGIQNIVCGAPNARLGLHVLVALPGAELPAIGATIKKGVIRGQESNGMCCSLLELGIDKSVLSETSPSLNGIEELPEDVELGDEEILEHLGLVDYLFDINILANRPDCLSVYGMAKELSAVLDRPLKKIELPSLGELESKIKVSSKTDSCKAFSLLEISNFVEGETPLKIVRYLQAMGIRSINLIVDIGNFSMLLTGQPLHMYDLSKMESDSFIVKDDYDGKFVALDDKEYDVIKGDVVVTDGNKPLCLGGVMGGKDVECDDKTSHIGIEAAHFYHAAIRHTVNRTGLASDSSARFIKGVNPHLINMSLAFALKLIKELSPETEIVSYTSYSEVEEYSNCIDYGLEYINHRLGSSFTQEEIDEVLKKIRVVRKGDKLYPPYDRLDLKEMCDITEEVFRLNDPARIVPSLDCLPIVHGSLTEEQIKRRKIREHLVENGFLETLTYALVDSKKINDWSIFKSSEPYVILNPMTADHMYVRTDLLSSLVEVAEYNIAHKNSDFDLFEVSSVDLKEGTKTYLALVMSGKRNSQGQLNNVNKDFYDIKGAIVSVFDLLGINSKRYSLVPSTNPCFHPGRSADIYIGKNLIGSFGELHPSINKHGLLAGELDLNQVYEIKTGKTKFATFSVFPTVTRDLCFTCPSLLEAQTLIDCVQKSGGQLVKSVDVFDVYEKDNTKSIAISIILSADHTLTETEIQETISKIIEKTESSLKVSLKQ